MWKNKDYEFVKYYNGNAYYSVLKTDLYHAGGATRVTIRHFLSHGPYEARRGDVVSVKWEDIPESYRMDGCAFNNFIRDNCDDYPEIQGKNRGKNTTAMSKQYVFCPKGTDGKQPEMIIVRKKSTNQYGIMEKEDFESEPPMLGDSWYASIYELVGEEDLNDSCQESPDMYELFNPGSISQQLWTDSYAAVTDLESSLIWAEVEGSPYVSLVEIPYSGDFGFRGPGPILFEADAYKVSHHKSSKKKGMKSNILSSLGLEMGKYEGTELALSMAGIAIKKKDGNHVVYDKANKQLIEVGDLKMDVPFYMMPIAYAAIQPGDLLKIDGSFYIVDAKTADSGLKCIQPTTGSHVNKIARTNMWNCHFYTKMVSLMDGFGGMGTTTPGTTQVGGPLAQMNPMMMMLMMGGDSEGDSNMDGMVQMMLMGQMMGSGGGMFGMGAAPAQGVPAKVTARRSTAKKK